MGCRPEEWGTKLQIPNCDDPVFRMWCEACNIIPGSLLDRTDARLAQLEGFMQSRYDDTFDPYQDHMDDYLTRDFD